MCIPIYFLYSVLTLRVLLNLHSQPPPPPPVEWYHIIYLSELLLLPFTFFNANGWMDELME